MSKKVGSASSQLLNSSETKRKALPSDKLNPKTIDPVRSIDVYLTLF